MNHQRCLICLFMILVNVPGVVSQGSENIALGKKYELSPAPNYRDCLDSGDATQLTDGKVTKEYFWTQPETVGWTNQKYAAITVDLERIEPIGGVSFHTAAGVADVRWPLTIRILTSDDGRSYRDNGDLVALDLKSNGPWPKGYAIRRLTTSELHTRGRFVRFVAVSSPYIFCDEVEIFRGSPDLLQGQPGGTSVPSDISSVVARWKSQSGIRRRFEADIAAVKRAIDTSNIADPAIRETLNAQWTNAGTALRASELPNDAAFRAVLPYNETHAQLFQVQAALWKALGRTALTYAVPATWDPTDLAALPSTGGRSEVHTMRGEYRAAAINLANASSTPIEARMHFEGLPGAPTPEYVTVHEVPWTDTVEGQPVTAALPLARREGSAWRVTVMPGLVRQIWLTFHAEKTPPGDYSGKLVVESPQNEPLQAPVRLRVYPLDFPRQTTLQLGGWDDTDGKGHLGMTPQNRKPFIEHLQNYFVNAPWATNSVMMQCSFAADGTVKLNTQTMDDWLADWPNARMYFVFLAIADYSGAIGQQTFGGAKPGTAGFDRRVGVWITAWVRHLGAKGISPERLGLLLHDEPHEGGNIESFLAWAKAIRAAEPKVRIWEDPSYADPTKAPTALFEACDVVCPHRPMWIEKGKPFEQFYRNQQQKGRTLNFYSCLGPARLLDPYSYYRLQAWHCSQIGATGSFYWAFGDNSGASSWNEYNVVSGPYTPLFLDDTTVVAGKQMEAIREGVEDYEYFVILRNAIDKAKAAGRSDAVLSKAESLLATATTEVLDAPGADALRWHTSKDRTKADAVRIQILETLSGLTH